MTSSRRKKGNLAWRWINSPLLMILLYDWRFRVLLAVTLVVCLAGAALLPKIWRTTPKGVPPEIKISGLDMIQARSLAKAARAAEARGDFAAALNSWRSAVANNPGKGNNVQNYLNCYFKQDDPHPSDRKIALQQAFWLLRIGGTNQADLKVAIKLFEKHRYWDLVALSVETAPAATEQPLRESYAKALFQMGDVAGFNRELKKLEEGAKVTGEMALYAAAYRTGWGEGAEKADATETLKRLLADPELSSTAHRLNLLVQAKLQNPEEYRASLTVLENRGLKTLFEEIQYWRLLAHRGQRNQAIEAIRTANLGTDNPVELVALGELMFQLGMNEEALATLKEQSTKFPYSVRPWILYGDRLIALKRWNDLRAYSLLLRTTDIVRDRLQAFSYYLEGRAEHGLGRMVLVEPLFEKAAESLLANATMTPTMASEMMRLGYVKPALEMLKRFESQSASEPTYWLLLFTAAAEAKDVNLMRKAAEKAYELAPENLVAMNNYAAILLIEGTQPELAATLTLRVFEKIRNSGTTINRAAALTLNRRHQEALETLQKISPQALAEQERNVYHFVMTQVHEGLGNKGAAQGALGNVSTNKLFEPQLKWLKAHQLLR